MPSRAACAVLILVVVGLAGCRSSHLASANAPSTPGLSSAIQAEIPTSIVATDAAPLHRHAEGVETHGAEEHEHWKRNEISLFLGYTSVREREGPTVGLTYVRWFCHDVGAAVFVEGVFGDETTPIAGAGIMVKPNERAGILLAFGASFKVEEGKSRREAKGLMRIGGSYLVAEIGRIRILPAAYVDFIQDEKPVVVFGVELAREF